MIDLANEIALREGMLHILAMLSFDMMHRVGENSLRRMERRSGNVRT
jgi:hypothetical protein